MQTFTWTEIGREMQLTGLGASPVFYLLEFKNTLHRTQLGNDKASDNVLPCRMIHFKLKATIQEDIYW